MLNLDLLISFSTESLVDKPLDSISDNVYQVMFEACERFHNTIELEYIAIFEHIKVTSEQKESLDNTNAKLKAFLVSIASSLPRRSYAKKRDIFDSLIIDEDDEQFTVFGLKSVLSLTYELDMHLKEYKKYCLSYEKEFIRGPTIQNLEKNSFIDSIIESKENKHKLRRNFNSLIRNKTKNNINGDKKERNTSKITKNRSKSFDSQISEQNGDSLLNIQFCETLIDSYVQLVQQCNYNCVKQLEQNGYKDLVNAIESYLDDLYNDELFMYIKNRVTVTRVLIKLMEELKLKSFNAYTDKILKPANDSMPLRKGSTYSDIKTYNKVDTTKLSLYLSRIRSLPFSQENYSLMEEIQLILKDKKRFSDLNIEEIDEIEFQKQRKTSEAINMINQNDDGFRPQSESQKDDFHNNMYSCYCAIF